MAQSEPQKTLNRSLSSMRVQFAPEVQPIKEAAFDEIVQNVMYSNRGAEPVRIEEIASWLEEDCLIQLYDTPLLIASLDRLRSVGIVTAEVTDGVPLHSLSGEGVNSIQEVYDRAERQLQEITLDLFRDAPGGATQYREMFIECLCFIFADLAEESAAIVSGKVAGAELVNRDLISKSLALAAGSVGKDQVRIALARFFNENDPRFGQLKLELAQNYYIVKAFGADPDGALLTATLFQGAQFYIDTNLLIGSVAPTQGRYQSTKAFVELIKEVGLEAIVCEITAEELKRVHLRMKEDVSLRDRVPPGLSMRVGLVEGNDDASPLTYQRIPLSSDTDFLEINDILGSCQQAIPFTRFDDEWFDKNESSSEVNRFSKELKRTSVTKGDSAAKHDALLLMWVASERARVDDNNIFVLTADSTLPGLIPPGSDNKPVAMTLSALMQWATPVIGKRKDDTFPAAFAELFRSRVLPQRQLLSLSDFRVFEELHMQSEALPPEDVEGCIKYLQANAGNLDSRNARDLQSLAREVSKYFSDPGRKFNQELIRLANELEEERKKSRGIRSEYDAKLEDQDARHAEQIDELTGQQSQLEGALGEIKASVLQGGLQRSGWIRVIVSSVIAALTMTIAASIAIRQDDGSIYDRVVGAWLFIAPVGGLSMTTMFWFYVGSDRRRAIGIPW